MNLSVRGVHDMLTHGGHVAAAEGIQVAQEDRHYSRGAQALGKAMQLAAGSDHQQPSGVHESMERIGSRRGAMATRHIIGRACGGRHLHAA